MTEQYIQLTPDEYGRLKAVCTAAQELVTAIPMITGAGGHVMRQNILVVELANSLEAANGIEASEVQNVSNGRRTNPTPNNRRARAAT